MPDDAYTSNLRRTITDAFRNYGYAPSAEEIDSLLGTAEQGVLGAYGGGTARATGAVANYVNTVRGMQETNADNPLSQILSDERGFFNSTQSRAADYLTRATGVPQLFGGLTPDQIDQYLAPVKEQLKQSNAGVESTFARRGLPGSNLEANSLAEQSRLFGENVLKTGLDVGLNQQNLYANLGATLYGMLPGLQGQIAQTGTTLSEQQRYDAALRSQLPLLLGSYTAGQRSMTENESVLAQQFQAAKEAGHKGGFNFGLNLGPLSFSTNNRTGQSNLGLSMSTADLASLFTGAPNPGIIKGGQGGQTGYSPQFGNTWSPYNYPQPYAGAGPIS